MSHIISLLNQMGVWFCEYAGAMLLQVTVLIAILFVIDAVLRRHVRAVLRYWLWMLVLVKLVLPVSFSFPTGLAYWLPRSQPGVNVDRQETEATEMLPVTAPVTIPPVQNDGRSRPHPGHGVPHRTPRPGLWEAASEGAVSMVAARAPMGNQASHVLVLPSWRAWLLVGWFVGVLILGLWVLRRSLFVRRLVRQGELANRHMVETLDECRLTLHVRQPVKLRISAEATSPAVCGLLRPTILLPSGFCEQVSPRQLKAIVIHELAHVRRGDLAVNLAQTVLQVVYFYNPLVWLANAMIRRVREQATDEVVLVALGEEGSQYSVVLIDIAERVFRRPVAGLAFIGVAESGRALTGRIQHIVRRPYPVSAKLGVAGFVCVMVAAATLLPMAAAESPAATVRLGDAGRSATTEPAEDTGDVPGSQPAGLLGPVQRGANRVEDKLKFDNDLVLQFPYFSDTPTDFSRPSVPRVIKFGKRENRIRGRLRMPVWSDGGRTWWVRVELLDNTGQTLSADEKEFKNPPADLNGPFTTTVAYFMKTLDFDLGPWDHHTTARRFAVIVESVLNIKDLAEDLGLSERLPPGNDSATVRFEVVKSPSPLNLAMMDVFSGGGLHARGLGFTYQQHQLVGHLLVAFPSAPETTWQTYMELLDEDGKVLAHADDRFESNGLVHGNLAFERIQMIEVDFGQREDISAVKRVAVTIERLAVGNDPGIGTTATQEAGRTPKAPSPAELLARMTATDKLYRQGFTVAGKSDYGWPKTRHQWRLTMGKGQVALLQSAVEILDQKENRARPDLENIRRRDRIILPQVEVEKAVFVDPAYTAWFSCIGKPPVDLSRPGGFRSIDFMSETSPVYTREVLWVMGRGFSHHIQEITEVLPHGDGKLKAMVTTNLGLNPCELIIEPGADYMIRRGKVSYAYEFSNSGLQWIGKRCVPMSATWARGGGAPNGRATVVFERASAEADHELLDKVEKMMHPPYPTVMTVSDGRVWPQLTAYFYKDTSDGTFPVDQPVVPIHCDSVHMPTGREEFEAKQVPPRAAAEQFLSAFLKGDEEAAKALIARGSAASGQLAELRKTMGNVDELKVRCVRWSVERAVLLTDDLPLKSDPNLKAPVFLRLAQHDEPWLIETIDARLEEPFTRRLTNLLRDAN